MLSPDEAAIYFRLLGPFEALRDGEALALGGAKQRALLARLLVSPNEVVSRDRLIDDLWGEEAPKDAAHTVQVFVSRLRKALGRDVIATRAPGYLVRVDEDALDLVRFERLHSQGREALARGQAIAAERALTDALALIRGPALSEFIFETWAAAEVARIEDARLACLEERIEAGLALGRHGELAGELERLVHDHPLRERLRGQLMLALYRQGRQAEALECYQQTRALLDEELGIEPTSELRELHRRILNQDHALAVEALPEPARTNLPPPATSFLGRERELAEVKALLGRSDVRLLTMTGPGGTGKTRLALQAAGELADAYEDGVYWVSLASLREPELVLPAVAQALEAKQELPEHIGDTHLLLLLDNFEQVVEAAPGLAELLSTCPRLELLVTSRESLRLAGEQAYPVPPLDRKDGVELFLTRARAHEPGFRADGVVAELCSRLDNLPLAIELAAARTKALSPAQILERLSQRLDLLKGGRDADPRQQTLRATIKWSYALLSPEEQRLFVCLALFVGGFTLEAAEEVADADLDTLQSLVEKSLLRFTNERYWMLETIREYGAQRLEVSGSANELAQHHAEHFRALADAADPQIQKKPEEWLHRLEPEHDNFRAALNRLEASGESQHALWLAGALAGFWDAGGHVEEGRRRLESLLCSDDRPTESRAKALAGAALMARLSGDAATARLHAGEALLLYRELGDVRGTAYSSVMLGLGHADSGDFSKARQLFDDSALLFREAGDDDDALFATRLLGWMYEELGDSERALTVHEENLARARALANKQFEAQSLGALASIAIEQGRPDDAFSKMKEVLLIDRDRGAPIQIGLDLVRFARVLAFAGSRHADATRLLASAEAIREKSGAGTPPNVVRNIEQTLAVIRTQLDDTALSAAWEEGRALTADEAIQLALASID